jgi:sulfur carrier protein ThiS
MKVQLSITPSSGSSMHDNVDVPATGTSVEEVLRIAGKTASGMQIAVNGEPAALNTHVKPNDQVTLTERVRGS